MEFEQIRELERAISMLERSNKILEVESHDEECRQALSENIMAIARSTPPASLSSPPPCPAPIGGDGGIVGPIQ